MLLVQEAGGTGIIDLLDSDEEEIDPDSLAPTKARAGYDLSCDVLGAKIGSGAEWAAL